MTLLDQMRAVVTPHRSQEERTRARNLACALALDCEWLSEVVRHHVSIEQALEAVRVARATSDRLRALHWLVILLTGHSLAEQAVLYPAMALERQRAHALSAYADESTVKIELAALQAMDPMTPDFVDKLERLRTDLAYHLHEEECLWYPALFRGAERQEHARLSACFGAEFRRYMGVDADLL